MDFQFVLRPACLKDIKHVFDLSNDAVVRKHSIQTAAIIWEEHCTWFHSQITSSSCIFYIAETLKGEFIGQVRFNYREGEWLISISIVSQFRGMGISATLLNRACKMSCIKKIMALVKKENQPSLKSFAKAGFCAIGELSIHGALYHKLEWTPRTFIIAELSANHNHSLQIAKESVLAAAASGADAIKLQTYTADTMTLNSNLEWFQIHGTAWDGYNLYQLYKEAYTPWEWHEELFSVAKAANISFFSTPFDASAIDFLEKLSVPLYKIASFELVDIPLLERVGRTCRPVILSTGMASVDEIDEAVSVLTHSGTPAISLLKCTSAYPASPENINLATLSDMQARFNCRVGLSDHTLGGDSAIAAVALGATVIEKHFILDRSIGGPDSHFSCEPPEFKKMVDSIRLVEKAVGRVSYGCSSDDSDSKVFRRSLFVGKDLHAGEILTPEHIRCVRPGYGLLPKYYSKVLGKKVLRDLAYGMPLRWEDIQL